MPSFVKNPTYTHRKAIRQASLGYRSGASSSVIDERRGQELTAAKSAVKELQTLSKNLSNGDWVTTPMGEGQVVEIKTDRPSIKVHLNTGARQTFSPQVVKKK